MFDDLLALEPDSTPFEGFVALSDASPKDLLSAQYTTAQLLDAMAVPSDEEIAAKREKPPAAAKKTPPDEAAAARAAFEKLTGTGAVPAQPADQRAALAAMTTPDAVRHLVGMLTEYDWEFVEKAKELRSYTVTKIIEETQHSDARIRLKALQMLGNVTEVALFTERVEVTKKDATEAEIEARLRERLLRYTNAIDVTPTAAAPEALPAPAPAPSLDEEISAVASTPGPSDAA